MLDALDVVTEWHLFRESAMGSACGSILVTTVSAADKIHTMAQYGDNPLNQAARAAEKQRSRDEDARALASGEKSAEQLRDENEVFARLAPKTRVDLSASRSLG